MPADLEAQLVISEAKARKILLKFRKEMEKILGKPIPIDVGDKGDARALKKKEGRQKSSAFRITAFQRNLREGSRKLEERNEKARLRAIKTEQDAQTKAGNILRAQKQRQQNILSKRTNKQTIAIFQVQQAIEDFSFAGFRGASNNIALLASQFGGAGGLIALVGLSAASIFTMTNRLKGTSRAAKRASDAIKTLVAELIRVRDLKIKEQLKSAISPLVTREKISAARTELRDKIIERDILARSRGGKGSIEQQRKDVAGLLSVQESIRSAQDIQIRLQNRLRTDKVLLSKGERTRLEKAIESEGKIITALIKTRKVLIFRLEKLGTKVKLGKELFGPTVIKNIKDIESVLKDLNEQVALNEKEITDLDVVINGLNGRLNSLKGVLQGIRAVKDVTSLVAGFFATEKQKGLSGFALEKDKVSIGREKFVTALTEERTLFAERIARAAGDPEKIKAVPKIEINRLMKAIQVRNREMRAIEKEQRRRKEGGLFDAFGVLGKTKVDKEIDAIRKRKSALQKLFEAGEIPQQLAVRQLNVLESQLAVQLKQKDALKEQKKIAQDQLRLSKQKAKSAENELKALRRQRQASSEAFESTLFGAKRGFAGRVTSRQAERFKAFDRRRFSGNVIGEGPRKQRDTNIDRFFERLGLARDRSLIQQRHTALTGQAGAAKQAGDFPALIRFLKQRQGLEFEGSRRDPNLSIAFRFLQRAQQTQREIQAAFAAQRQQKQQAINNAVINIKAANIRISGFQNVQKAAVPAVQLPAVAPRPAPVPAPNLLQGAGAPLNAGQGAGAAIVGGAQVNSSVIGSIINNFGGNVDPEAVAMKMMRELQSTRLRRGRASKRGLVS